jgi:hypothetical protein
MFTQCGVETSMCRTRSEASRLNDNRRNLPVSEKLTECDGDQDRALVFEQHRRRLLGVSYRILGSVADAEDVLTT